MPNDKKYQVQEQLDNGDWKTVDRDIDHSLAIKQKKWRESHGAIARVLPMNHPKSTPRTKPMELMTFVARIAEDVRRGQLTNAAYTIFMPSSKKQAVVIAAYVLDQVRDDGNYAAFLRVLESFFND